MTELQALKERYRDDKARLLESVNRGGGSLQGIHKILSRLGELADNTLRILWKQAEMDDAFALVAVGGFGRGELFPHSDVDVLVLMPADLNIDAAPAIKSRVEGFIGSCWDVGLEIGSSVRTVTECVQEAQKDVTVQTSLLEARLVVGQKALFQDFHRKVLSAIDPQEFFVAKTLEMRQRHLKFENTPYSLEPNCKESPGGLRDLQTILWVAKAAKLGQTWDELAEIGLATPFEIKQIKHNEALLSLIRARLHTLAHRREDRLVFDMQTAVAETFKFSTKLPEGKMPVRLSEKLMRRYYWTAKAVTQLSQILMLNIEERLNPSTHEPRPINERFFEKAGMIEVASDDLYEREPHAILETFLLFQQNVSLKGLSARTLRALYNARHLMNAKFRNDPVNHATFMRMMRQTYGITHVMRLMNQTSVLGRYLSVFRKIVGQMQHDLFHVYTVDQHILMVLRNVRRFFIVEHAHEYPFCSQLAAGWDKPYIFFIAALFHDIAKGRGGDHSELGAHDVRRFCKQHGVSKEDTQLIEFLVSEHLTMSRVAQKEDLSDPDVIAAFAKRVGNERYLTALYLLTVADIRGTSPKVWNAWKGKLLEDLYRYTLRVLGGRAPDVGAEVEESKRDALALLAPFGLATDVHEALWNTLGVSYFMRHDAGDIAWHTRMLAPFVFKKKSDKPPKFPGYFESTTDVKAIVRARISPAGEGLQVMVYTPDQPDLFARICGYFDQAGFSILDAKVHTANNGYALDTFQVVTSLSPEHYREFITMVEADLDQTIEEPGPLPAPSRGRVSRRVKSFPIAPRVELRPDDKAQHWLLTISASDRAGLLYGVALILAKHRINLQLAKVTTLGERVEDTFLIDGAELSQNKAQIEIEKELLEALES